MYNTIIISIVIPTFNRSNYLIKILNNFRSNFLNFKNFEVIICDSYSKDNTKIKLDAFKNNSPFPISYFNVLQNNNALKRNIGIRKAKGKYIILLDDDCIPTEDFVKQYYFIIKKYNRNKNIYCGSVKYPNYLLKNNFVNFRQSRHFFLKKKYFISEKKLEAKNIVTMNMAFDKKTILKKNLLFNENFNRYGFEDYEFGYRLIKNGFKLVPSSPLIYHLDDRNLEKFLMKIIFLGKESKNFLIKINKKASLKNNFIILENNFIIKILVKINFIYFLMTLIQKYFLFSEKYIKFHNFFYKLVIANAYLIGCVLSKKHKKHSTFLSGWYK